MSIKGPKCARPAEARAAGTVSEPADGPASSLSGRAPFNQVPPEKRDQDGDEAVDEVEDVSCQIASRCGSVRSSSEGLIRTRRASAPEARSRASATIIHARNTANATKAMPTIRCIARTARCRAVSRPESKPWRTDVSPGLRIAFMQRSLAEAAWRGQRDGAADGRSTRGPPKRGRRPRRTSRTAATRARGSRTIVREERRPKGTPRAA